MEGLRRLSENLFLFADTCNVYVLRNGDGAILIDFARTHDDHLTGSHAGDPLNADHRGDDGCHEGQHRLNVRVVNGVDWLGLAGVRPTVLQPSHD